MTDKLAQSSASPEPPVAGTVASRINLALGEPQESAQALKALDMAKNAPLAGSSAGGGEVVGNSVAVDKVASSLAVGVKPGTFMPLYRLGRFAVRLVLRNVYGLKSQGLENIPAAGSCLLACNHQSLMDPPLLSSAIEARQVLFMAKRELLETPLLGPFLARCGCFWVDRKSRDGKAVEQGMNRLQEGALVGIFPEGTRSRDGQLLKGRSGAAMLALKTGSPVVPCCVFNTLEVAKRHYWPGPHISIRFGPPLQVSPCQEPKPSQIRELRDKIMAAIADLQKMGPVT